MLKLTKQNKLELFWTVCSTAQHSSGYKPIFLDSMELVAIEQARRLVYSARAAQSTLKRARSPPPCAAAAVPPSSTETTESLV